MNGLYAHYHPAVFMKGAGAAYRRNVRRRSSIPSNVSAADLKFGDCCFTLNLEYIPPEDMEEIKRELSANVDRIVPDPDLNLVKLYTIREDQDQAVRRYLQRRYNEPGTEYTETSDSY